MKDHPQGLCLLPLRNGGWCDGPDGHPGECEFPAPLCGYCGALDNGACAYPSESKPGCIRDSQGQLDAVEAAERHLERMGIPT